MSLTLETHDVGIGRETRTVIIPAAVGVILNAFSINNVNRDMFNFNGMLGTLLGTSCS